MTDINPIPPIEDIRQAAMIHASETGERLVEARQRRTELNEEIRRLVNEKKTADRIVKALNPRQRTS